MKLNIRLYTFVSMTLVPLLALNVSLAIAQATSAQTTVAGPLQNSVHNSGLQKQSHNNNNSSNKQLITLPSASTAVSLLSQTKSGTSEPLPADRAFVLTARRADSTLSLLFTVAPGYYLYKDKIRVQSQSLGRLDMEPLPKGIIKFDETFGKALETYRDTLALSIIHRSALIGDELIVDVYSQGCADIGICYPPQLQRLSFSSAQLQAKVTTLPYLPPEASEQASNSSAVMPPAQFSTINSTTQSNASNPGPDHSIGTEGTERSASSRIFQQALDIKALLTSSHPFWVFIGFIGFGLLLTFTPCVLPMLPIVSAIVLGKGTISQSDLATQDTANSAWRGFTLSLAYVLGMAIVYTAIGILAGLAGAGLTAFLQHPLLMVAFAGVMVALAGAQFGWYTLTLPQHWRPHTHVSQSKTSLKRYTGLVGMGAVSAVMVGPCVTAPLAGVLAFIAQSGNVWMGGLALFGLSLGMGLPMLLLGAGGAQYLPKTGAWVNEISYGFGLMLLAVAVWILQSLLPQALITAMWVGLLLLAAEWLGAMRPWSMLATRLIRLKAIVGYMCALWAVATLLGMAAGVFDVTSPLLAFKPTHSSAPRTASNQQRPMFTLVASESLESALLQSKGKPILLDVYADWCISCKEFEKFTFSDSSVAQAMEKFHLLKIDVTRNSTADQKILERLKLFGPPAIVFYTPSAQEVQDMRVIGFQSAAPFLQHLNQVLSMKR